MAATPTLRLCDDLVSALESAWAPDPPSSVERDYFPRFGDGEAETVKLTAADGRKVVICPADYDSSYETRGLDLYRHTVLVCVLERYDRPGRPSKAWVDERVDFVHEFVSQGFDFGRTGGPSWNRQLRTISIDVEVCDQEKLIGEGHLFLSVTEIVFEESRVVT